jgi:hypothetical protein
MNEIQKNTLDTIQALDETTVFEMIQNAPALSSQEEATAPFSNFSQNTDTSWKHVPREKVEEYLRNKLFFNTRDIDYDLIKQLAEIRSKDSVKKIMIPLDLVVCASGFDDWTGRSRGITKDWRIVYGGKTVYGNMPSTNVSMLYAGTPSELPPVNKMSMYIQPDKKIFFDNAGGDSHRIAAAILRGDKNIETEKLVVYQLDKNYL